MLRELGQLREGGGTFPRKAEIDPEDSVFVVFILPNPEDAETRPHLASIWLGLGEASAAAERVAREGHPYFPRGFEATEVKEVAVGRLLPDMQRHGSIWPAAPPVDAPTMENETARRMDEMEREIARLRMQLGTSTLSQGGAKPGLTPTQVVEEVAVG